VFCQWKRFNLDLFTRRGTIPGFDDLFSRAVSGTFRHSSSQVGGLSLPGWGRFYCQRVELPARSDRASMAPGPNSRKSPSAKCDRQGFAASWCIARIIGALTR
jgi:hypothetical protein